MRYIAPLIVVLVMLFVISCQPSQQVLHNDEEATSLENISTETAQFSNEDFFYLDEHFVVHYKIGSDTRLESDPLIGFKELSKKSAEDLVVDSSNLYILAYDYSKGYSLYLYDKTNLSTPLLYTILSKESSFSYSYEYMLVRGDILMTFEREGAINIYDINELNSKGCSTPVYSERFDDSIIAKPISVGANYIAIPFKKGVLGMYEISKSNVRKVAEISATKVLSESTFVLNYDSLVILKDLEIDGDSLAALVQTDMTLAGTGINYANGAILLLDISNPAKPLLKGVFFLDEEVNNFAFYEDKIAAGRYIYDVEDSLANPIDPKRSEINLPFGERGDVIYSSGDVLVYESYNNVRYFDIFDWNGNRLWRFPKLFSEDAGYFKFGGKHYLFLNMDPFSDKGVVFVQVNEEKGNLRGVSYKEVYNLRCENPVSWKDELYCMSPDYKKLVVLDKNLKVLKQFDVDIPLPYGYKIVDREAVKGHLVMTAYYGASSHIIDIDAKTGHVKIQNYDPGYVEYPYIEPMFGKIAIREYSITDSSTKIGLNFYDPLAGTITSFTRNDHINPYGKFDFEDGLFIQRDYIWRFSSEDDYSLVLDTSSEVDYNSKFHYDPILDAVVVNRDHIYYISKYGANESGDIFASYDIDERKYTIYDKFGDDFSSGYYDSPFKGQYIFNFGSRVYIVGSGGIIKVYEDANDPKSSSKYIVIP